MGEGGKGRRVAAASKVMLVSGNQVPSGVTPSAVRCGRQVGFISSRPYREFIVFNRLRVSPELSWNGGTARAFVTGGDPLALTGDSQFRSPVATSDGVGCVWAAMTRQ